MNTQKTPVTWVLVAISAVLGLISVLDPPTREALLVSRMHILVQGEVWRLATGHFVHLTRMHALWNLVMLVVLGLAFEPLLGRVRTVLVLVGAWLLTSAFFLVGNSGLEVYGGLSGLSSGLVSAGVLASIAEQRSRVRRGKSIRVGVLVGSLMLFCGLCAKMTYEALTAHSFFMTDAPFVVDPRFHLLGMLGGVLGWFVGLKWANRARRYAWGATDFHNMSQPAAKSAIASKYMK